MGELGYLDVLAQPGYERIKRVLSDSGRGHDSYFGDIDTVLGKTPIKVFQKPIQQDKPPAAAPSAVKTTPETGSKGGMPGQEDTTTAAQDADTATVQQLRYQERLNEIRAAVGILMNKTALSKEDEKIFEDLEFLSLVYYDEALNLLGQLISHADGMITYSAIKTLERIRSGNSSSKIIEIYIKALLGNNEAAHSCILNNVLIEFVLRNPGLVTLNMVAGIENAFRVGEEWPRRYAFQILSIIVVSPEAKKGVKEKVRFILKEAIRKEYIKTYPQGEDISNFLDSWLSNNPFSLQSLRLENVPNAIVGSRNITPIKLDRQTSYLVEKDGAKIPAAVIPMGEQYPDIVEEKFPIVNVGQGRGVLSEGLISMRSEGFSECHAVLIRDKSTNNYLLFHFLENAPFLEGDLPFQKYIEYLGTGEKEAIYLANSSNRAVDYAHRSEEYLFKNFGIKTLKFIKVNAERRGWSLVFRPTTNQLITYSSNEAYIFDAFDLALASSDKEKVSGVIGSPTVDSSSATAITDTLVSKAPGGIDFRFLPIVTQSMDNLKLAIQGQNLGDRPLAALGVRPPAKGSVPIERYKNINLTQEWRDIERLVKTGTVPSAERLKEYFAASCFKGSLDSDMDKITSCIADILRMQEELCCSTDPTLKDILVVLGSGRSGEELKLAFSK